MISREDQEKVAGIVRKMLTERFSSIAFGPIRVVPAVDEFGDGDGEEYLRILVVFDGDQKALDARWTSTLIRRIRPKLSDVGVDFLGVSELLVHQQVRVAPDRAEPAGVKPLEAETVIRGFPAASAKDRRAFAVYLLLDIRT